MQRGQALFETAAFLPLILLPMFAIYFFAQYGVLQERAVQAARFATLVTNASGAGSNAYSLTQMYAELHREGADTDVSIPSSSFSCASTAQSDAQSALTQGEPLPGGGTGATSAPFFNPDAGTSAATNCLPETLDLASSDADVASSYFVVQYTHVEADKTVQPFVAWVTGTPTSHVRAAMSFIRPASPDTLIYCSPGFASAVAGALGAIEPVTAAGPYAGYQTPPPTSPHTC
ncbi:MAG: hypothetical protein ACLPYS_19750 [Vulcanimicrobiaceae bacterium]